MGYHYGFNVLWLTEKELLFYEMHLPALEAEREYKERVAHGTLTPDSAYMLIKQFTGDDDEADRVRAEMLSEEIRIQSQGT